MVLWRKLKHCKKDRQFRASSVEQEILCDNNLWCNKFKFIQKSPKGEGFALSTVCGSNFSIAHGGENDINRHKDTSKHKGYVDAAQQ